jgi:hypothetical protein
MEPTNDHERAIAQAVDAKLMENPDHPSIAWDIAMSMDFKMSSSDTQFLIGYVQWRLTHPINRGNSK